MTDRPLKPPAEIPVFLTSSLLADAGFFHAFFTRVGGVSSGPFESLNFATKSGDDLVNLERNLEIAGGALSIPPEKIYFLRQVHGTQHVVVDGTEERGAIEQEEGDIVLSRTRGIAAAIRTADCVPLLLASPETGWVAAVHAGWQGCVRQVVPAALRALSEKGAGKLLAAIGPHISLDSFEVGQDVAEQLRDASPDPEIVDYTRQRPHVNLRKMVRAQLREGGLRDSEIDDVAGCTVIQRERFFSYRRDGNPSGRMLTAIVGRGAP